MKPSTWLALTFAPMFTLTLALMLFSLVAVPSCAAQQDCTRTVLVSFYDQPTKNEIQTLKTEDFELRIDGKKLPVASSTRDFNNRVLILLETNGTDKSSKVDDIVDMVTLQARGVDAGKPIAFGIYSDKAIFTDGFISNPKKRATAIAGIMDEAGTLGKRVALWNALHEAIKVFGPHQPGDTILLVGEPYDDKSNRSAEAVEKELLASGTRLFLMRRIRESRVDQADFAWRSHEFEKMIIDRMTHETGGLWSEYVPTLIRFAWAGYMLDIKLPPGIDNPHKWKVEFQGEAAQVHRKTNYYFPARFPGCSTETAENEKETVKVH
jgi:hypothetical protein